MRSSFLDNMWYSKMIHFALRLQLRRAVMDVTMIILAVTPNPITGTPKPIETHAHARRHHCEQINLSFRSYGQQHFGEIMAGNKGTYLS